MTQKPPTRQPVRQGEEGYTLVAVMFLLFLLTLSLSVAATRMAREIQRDHEVETMQRGKQYIRAIRLYYRNFTAYPPTIDALVKTQNLRFLRKRYKDPITGKDDWKPVRFGQNKAPTAMGFFGQPLTATTLAGMGPSGGNGTTGSSSVTSSFMNSSSTTSSSTATPTTGQTQQGTTGTDSSGTSGSDSNFGSSGQTFGGLGIIGFSPASPKESLLVYKTKSHYNEWEFVYDPILERMYAAGSAGIGTPAANAGNSTSTNTNGFTLGGVSPSGSGSNSSNGNSTTSGSTSSSSTP